MISHKNGFIFVHIPKTGGTSYAYLLHKFCENVVKHQFASELIDESKKGIDYFKFTLIRNPWEREVSRYYYQKQTPANENYKKANSLSFKEWLIKMQSDEKFMSFYGAPQLDWLVDKNDNILLDYIARLERIHEDWKIISDVLKINDNIPWLNRSKHKHYSEYYDDETQELIYSNYKKDIDFFNYKFNKISDS